MEFLRADLLSSLTYRKNMNSFSNKAEKIPTSPGRTYEGTSQAQWDPNSSYGQEILAGSTCFSRCALEETTGARFFREDAYGFMASSAATGPQEGPEVKISSRSWLKACECSQYQVILNDAASRFGIVGLQRQCILWKPWFRITLLETISESRLAQSMRYFRTERGRCVQRSLTRSYKRNFTFPKYSGASFPKTARQNESMVARF